MGTFDTIMVSNVGSAAISAVSLVDSINVLLVQALSALATGGTIVCSQYIGSKNREGAISAAKQLVLIMFILPTFVMLIFLWLRAPILRAIFGSIETDVMEAALIYFLITVLSYPFLGIFDASASIFRAQENSRLPMIVSVISNVVNVGGNALLIYGFSMGVKGAALATLASRIFSAGVMVFFLRNPQNLIYVRNFLKIRPDKKVIKKILTIGIPCGIENSLFQVGKLAIQSTVSLMGTTAMAAQAMTIILEGLTGTAASGVGLGMMTVVGECIGAGEKKEAAYYIKKLSIIAEVLIIIVSLVTFALTKQITSLAGMEEEAAQTCFDMMLVITIVKPIVWVFSFLPAYGMRAAGDVKFAMVVSVISMWVFRVGTCVFLARVLGFGPMAVWIGMFADWTVRGIIYTCRYLSGKWYHKSLAED